MLIGRDSSCLLVVDIQERLLPAMQDPMLVVRNTGILMQAAARLGIPILVSEQYPQGLGPTVAELRASGAGGRCARKDVVFLRR